MKPSNAITHLLLPAMSFLGIGILLLSASQHAAIQTSTAPEVNFIQTDCNDPILVDCNIEVQGTTEGGGDDFSNTFFAGCADISLVGCDYARQEDRLYQFELMADGTVSVDFAVETTNSPIVGLFLFKNACTEVPECLGYVESSSAEFALDAIDLEAGTYQVIVDQRCTGTGPNITSYSFVIRCDIPLSYDEISCGEKIFSSTIDAASQFDLSENESCFEFLISDLTYGAGDRLYQLALSEEQTISISLEHDASGDLLLFLLSDEGGRPSDCLAISDQFTEAGKAGGEEILTTLEAGTYWILVDGLTAFGIGPVIDEADFRLSIQCLSLPTACDLEGTYVSNGNPIFGTLVDTLPRILSGLACAQGLFDETAIGTILIYNKRSSEQEFTIDFSNTDVDAVTAFVFDCRDSGQGSSSACLGRTQDGSLNLGNVPAGYYYIVVASIESSDYELIIGPGGPLLGR